MRYIDISNLYTQGVESKVFKGPLASSVIRAATGRSCFFGAVPNRWIWKHRNLLRIRSISCLNLDCSPTSKKKLSTFFLSRPAQVDQLSILGGIEPGHGLNRVAVDPQPTALCYVKTLPGLSFCWLFVEPSVFGPASETSKNGDAADGNVPDWKVMFETCPLHEFIHHT